MKVSILLLVLAVLFISTAWAQNVTREAGYGISNTISLFNGGGSSDVAVGVSNSVALSTLLGQSGYGISGAVYIDTILPTVASLSIERQLTGIHLAWEPVQGATSYKIYRGSSPYQPKAQMLLLGETTDTNWIDPTASNVFKSFYLIITVGQ